MSEVSLLHLVSLHHEHNCISLLGAKNRLL